MIFTRKKRQIKTLPKAQQTHGIEYFDSINIFCLSRSFKKL